MSAAAAAAVSTIKGTTLCPHTCGCVSQKHNGNMRPHGQMSFVHLNRHVQSPRGHPLCSSGCPAYVESMHCAEELSDLDEEAYAPGGASPRKRPAAAGDEEEASSHVPSSAGLDTPATKKARPSTPYMSAVAFQEAAAAAQGYMTSSQFQAAILAKVEVQVATLRARFGQAQKEAIEKVDAGRIVVNFADQGHAATMRFIDELARAGFVKTGVPDENTLCFALADQ